jgi:hypothetical protein
MDDEKKDPALEDAPDTPGGEKPEKVEDRPMVGTVTPEDYTDTRKRSKPS